MLNPIEHVSCKYGAPMGRRGVDEGDDLGQRLYLRHIPLDNGGYDSGGAYWGHGASLYWCGNDGDTVSLYFRARGRDAAKAHVRESYPAARFFR